MTCMAWPLFLSFAVAKIKTPTKTEDFRKKWHRTTNAKNLQLQLVFFIEGCTDAFVFLFYLFTYKAGIHAAVY